MTLYELATGVLPGWGEGGMDPPAGDEEARLDTELFDPAIREALTDFFATALRRDSRRRFDNADDMHLAWRKVFRGIDHPATEDTDSDDVPFDLSAIDDLDHATRLAVLGLSARELNAADRIGATTVGQLLELPNIRMYRNRGIGQRVIRRLRALREQLAEVLPAQPVPGAEADESPQQLSIDRLVANLENIRLDPEDRAPVGAWLGLARNPATHQPCELPTLREASEAAACPRGRAQTAIERAVGKWIKNRWMTVLRDEVADTLQRKEGILTVEELAVRLLGLHGSVTDGPVRLQRAGAVIQATLEAEATRESVRFILYRGVHATLVIATEQLGSAFAGSPTDRAGHAEALAEAAARLAREDPLPSPRRVEETLAAVPKPEPDRALSADRRLRLAVAAAPAVALSSRLELYPVGMSAERALRMGSNALLGPKRLTVDHLKSRIQSRFPDAEPLPDRPALDELLRKAEIPLQWQPATDPLPAGYAPPSRGTGLTRHTSTLRRRTTGTHPDDPGPEAQTAQRFEDTLRRALRDRRVLIVTCALSRVERAARELAPRFGLEPVSVDRLLIEAMRAGADRAGADWRVVLQADRAARDSADWRRLHALVQRALPEVRRHLLEHDRPLLVRHLGLLVRYGRVGLIQSLRDAVVSSAVPARILLVPGDEYRPPILDNVVLPVITPADWVHLPRAWLENAHRARAGAVR